MKLEQEKNTTVNYEVVCKTESNRVTILQVNQQTDTASSKNSQQQRSGRQLAALPLLPEDQPLDLLNADSLSFENDYYNFPPRHPRHGHLKAGRLFVHVIFFYYDSIPINVSHSLDVGEMMGSILVSNYD